MGWEGGSEDEDKERMDRHFGDFYFFKLLFGRWGGGGGGVKAGRRRKGGGGERREISRSTVWMNVKGMEQG